MAAGFDHARLHQKLAEAAECLGIDFLDET